MSNREQFDNFYADRGWKPSEADWMAWQEATRLATLPETRPGGEAVKTYTLTEEQKDAIDLLLAYSNAVSMIKRSPGTRSDAWIKGKVADLYDQQCKVETILAALPETRPEPVGVREAVEMLERVRKWFITHAVGVDSGKAFDDLSQALAALEKGGGW